MFRGNYQTRMDEKGRLKVPADFKRELDERYGSAQFYVTSRDGKVAEIHPMEEWEKIEAKLDKLPTASPAIQKFLDVTNYYGQVVEMDAQGRLLLPGLLREDADLKGEVAVVGNMRYLKVRNQEAYRKRITENPLTDEDAKALSELGI
jgi:MraZ protein